eukprot:scaffold56125_cov41-Phaeocystis_antarctica.AAC.1
MWRSRTRTPRGVGGEPAILLPCAMIKPRTQAVAPVLLSPHSGGGHTVGATTPAPLEQADFGGRSGGKGLGGSETASDAEANRRETSERGRSHCGAEL